MHAYILLDRTGSMQDIWSEALSSVNAYARGLAEPDPGAPDVTANVTLAVFDRTQEVAFDILRRIVLANDWTPVTDDEASPRGMTPLFDAIGRMTAIAREDNPERAVIVIMTDGHENASREVTRDGAKAALDACRERGWEVVFLGAEFAAFDDAGSVGVVPSKHMAMSQGAMARTMQRLARKSRRYAAYAEEVDFDADDRAGAGEEDVKRRKGVK